MRWSWRRRVTKTMTRPGPSEATKARIQAERDLEEVRSRTPRYRALAAALREIREENHLAERFLSGGPDE